MALPHPQSKTGISESTVAPERGQGTREVLIVGRRDLMAKGQRGLWTLKDSGLQLRTQQ